MKKMLVLTAAIYVAQLTGCSQGGQQSTGVTQSAPGPEHTTPVPASSVDPIATDLVANAQLSGGSCSLDSIDGNYAASVPLSKDKPHVFRGWLESDQRQPAGAFKLVLVGSQPYGIPAKTGVKRPDVALGQNDPALEVAGFNFSVALDSLPAGDYSIRFMMDKGNKPYWCDAKKTVAIE